MLEREEKANIQNEWNDRQPGRADQDQNGVDGNSGLFRRFSKTGIDVRKYIRVRCMFQKLTSRMRGAVYLQSYYKYLVEADVERARFHGGIFFVQMAVSDFFFFLFFFFASIVFS